MSAPVLKLVAQRVALGFLLLLAVSVLIFVGTQILPGDVAQSILGQSATPLKRRCRQRATGDRHGAESTRGADPSRPGWPGARRRC